jgi:hypothetical protein
MDKEERFHKKNIAKRLRLSDKKLWSELKKEQQDAIVDRYYHVFDIENMTLKEIGRDNYNVRSDLALVMMGTLLGVFGGMFVESISEYLPEGVFFDVAFAAFFLAFAFYFLHFIDKAGAENFRQNKVLSRLKKQLEEEVGK